MYDYTLSEYHARFDIKFIGRRAYRYFLHKFPIFTSRLINGIHLGFSKISTEVIRTEPSRSVCEKFKEGAFMLGIKPTDGF